MKIGICSPHGIANYGTKLQAYAVQNYLESLGHDTEIIEYRRKGIKNFFKKCIKYLRKEKIKEYSFTNSLIRKNSINSFNNLYKISKPINSLKELKNYSKKFDAIVCGSDQIWLPSNIDNPLVNLKFVNKNCKKVAFSPSFGVSKINKKSKYKKFLSSFDGISVRENEGKEIIKKLLDIDVPVTLDPTLMLSKNDWDEIVNLSYYSCPKGYIFCYFLGKNKEHRDYVKKIAKEKNLKILNLAHFKGICNADLNFADEDLYDVSPCDFLKLIKNADIMCTDSFHGTVFSLIFNTDFITFERFNNESIKSTNSRIYTLLNNVGLKDRVYNSTFKFTKVNFELVSKSLLNFQQETTKYILTYLPIEINENNFKIQLPKEQCTGCTACYSICPKGAITFTKDKFGFKYPVINNDLCIKCKKCINTCQVLKKENLKNSINNVYYGQSLDENALLFSSSGGVFYDIARYVLLQNGYVCGASYDKDFSVKHIIINNLCELKKIQGSKYSSSNIDGLFVKIKQILEDGKLLLFVGTPCQARGLYNFLNKKYDNLILIDLLCYGIQSPVIWHKYLKENNLENIIDINMRKKSPSWNNYSIEITYKDNTKIIRKKQDDSYLNLYSKGIFLRESCYTCKAKAFPRVSDITLGDFWDYSILENCDLDISKGISFILINTDKGSKIFDNLKIKIFKVDDSLLREKHPLFCLPAQPHLKKDKFLKDYEKYDMKALSKMYGNTSSILYKIKKKLNS